MCIYCITRIFLLLLLVQLRWHLNGLYQVQMNDECEIHHYIAGAFIIGVVVIFLFLYSQTVPPNNK